MANDDIHEPADSAGHAEKRKAPSTKRKAARQKGSGIKISRETAQPLYLQIKNSIVERIKAGEWPPHHQFPTYKELSKEIGVSIVTIQQSVGVLVKEGILYNKRGVGVFVSPPQAQPQGKIIALLLSDVRHPFFSSLAHIIQTYAAKSKYTMLIFSLCDNHEDSLHAAQLLPPHMLAGIITTHSLAERLPEHFSEMLKAAGAVVFIDGYSSEYDCIETDNHLGIEMAMNHLVELGHRRIAFAAGQLLGRAGHERIAAFQSLLAEKGLPFDPPLLQRSVYKDDLAGETAAHMLLSLRDVPTAIICVSDLVARGVIRVARERGIKCPDELSVVGFDDLDFAQHLEPPLTTVRQPVVEIGQGAVDMLLERINSIAPYNKKCRILQLTPELVVRASTAPPFSKSSKSAVKRPR